MGTVLSSVVPESDIEGYHILFVHENSPAEKAGLEAFFDFIVALCGVVLVGQHDIFIELLQKNINRQIELKVFSTRSNTFRNVPITPTNDWNGQGLLGLTVNFCAVKDAFKNVQHVLEVHPNSPAYEAGLRSFSDYIIGTETGDDTANIDFMSLIKQYDKQSLKIFVYNSDDNICRPTIIKPNSQWAGNGILGCGIGTGYLHRIPVQDNQMGIKSTSVSVMKSIKENEATVNTSSEKTKATPIKMPYVPPNTPVLDRADASICSIDVEGEIKEEIHKTPPPKNTETMGETIA